MFTVLNIAVSPVAISVAVWLSKEFPVTAGFFVALPLATLLVLPLAHLQYGDAGSSILLARSIFVAIPVTLGFFLPFLLSERLGLNFWQAYAIGCVLLPVGYVAHKGIVRIFF